MQCLMKNKYHGTRMYISKGGKLYWNVLKVCVKYGQYWAKYKFNLQKPSKIEKIG